MIEVYALKIDKLKCEKFMQFISADKLTRIKRFLKFEDTKRTLFGDILARYAISENISIKAKDICFSKNDYGKPFLLNNVDLHFNISHSGEWVVCIVGNCTVGIDIEIVKTTDFEIAKRFFSILEYNELINKCDSKRQEYFYELWTLKESYVKAVGKGLSIPFDSFSMKVDNNAVTFESDNEFINYYFKLYNIDRKYKIAVCAMEDKFPEKVNVLNSNVLYDKISMYYSNK